MKRSVLRAINEVIFERKGMARAFSHNLKGKRIAIDTPGWIKYPVVAVPGRTIDFSEADLRNINNAVSNIRQEPTKVTFSDFPAGLEVPRPEQRPFWLEDLDVASAPLRGIIAASYGYRLDINEWDLLNPSQPHLSVLGASGSGKTEAIRSIVESMAMVSSPNELRIVVVDLKGMESLVALGDLPHCVGYAYRHGEADSLVSRVIDVLDERREQKNTTPRYLLVIDELLDIKQHCTPKMLDTWLPRIATLGRELGIHLLIGSQEMLSKEVGAQLKNHMYFRLAGIANDSLHSVAITGRAQVFAHHLPGRGQMFLVQSGKPHIRVQVPMVKDARAYAKRVQDRWGKDFETWNLDIPTFVDGESDAMTRVRSVFAEAWDDDRKKLRNGALTDICKAYFGEEAELAGGKQRKTKKLVEKLKEEIYA